MFLYVAESFKYITVDTCKSLEPWSVDWSNHRSWSSPEVGQMDEVRPWRPGHDDSKIIVINNNYCSLLNASSMIPLTNVLQFT